MYGHRESILSIKGSEHELSGMRGNAPAQGKFRQTLNRPLFCRPFRLYHLLLLVAVFLTTLCILLIVFFSLLHQRHSRQHHAVGSLVDLGYSRYQGVSNSQNVTSWLGMRYARPPTGQYRFAAPEDPLEETEVQNVTAFGPICKGNLKERPGSAKSDEDCLFINVFAPSNATTDSKLPVYLFIQGGGFNTNGNPNMDGTGIINAAGGNAVVVNFNYRVGAYGFLASQEMTANNTYALNVGLLDQRKAMQWVKDRISSFGGDPEHITLGGASAGAGSVVLHLTAYGGRDDNLFQAVTVESPAFPALRNVSESEVMFEALATNANCTQKTAVERLDCLRQMSLDDFQAAQSKTRGPFPGAKGRPEWYWGPTIDDDFITDYTYNLLNDDKFVKVPAIFGDTSNEATIFTPRSLATQAAADEFIQNNWPALTSDQLDSLHDVFSQGETYEGAGAWFSYGSDMFGMFRYICPGLALSNAFASAGIEAVYNYRWDVQTENNRQKGMGATHVAELGPVWSGGQPADSSPEYVHLHFASFIQSYDPNVHNSNKQPTWQKWGGVDGNNRILYANDNTTMEKVDQKTLDKCKIIHEIGASIKQ